MNSLSTSDVLEVLRQVKDPDLQKDIVSLGFIKNLVVDGGRVSFDINLTTPACPVKDDMKKEAHRLVSSLPGAREVKINLTAEVRKVGDVNKTAIQGVKNIVAVASGKGGVGKSTVAVNLATAMAQTGAQVGLLDADIYGPTVPLMMGFAKGLDVTASNEIIPPTSFGVRYMSMGFMAPGDKPLIWRGPMAHQALQQNLFRVRWGELDYLFVDLPPGTGDVHLTLVQSVQLAGGVLVSTPQDVGLTISMKTYQMFKTTNVRILGIIENMSGYQCSKCGHVEDIFGQGGVKEAATRLNIPYLGSVPLLKEVREEADSGRPIVASQPDSPGAKIYRDMAKMVAQNISIASFETPELKIVEEPV